MTEWASCWLHVVQILQEPLGLDLCCLALANLLQDCPDNALRAQGEQQQETDKAD